MTSLGIMEWTTDYFMKNKSSCITILESTDALKEIPSLNSSSSDNFKDKQLVRFCGMIQDMHNPEYYFKEYEVRNTETGTSYVRCGMYMDFAQCLPHEEIMLNSEHNKNSERHTCTVISTPGLNDWAKEKCSITCNDTSVMNNVVSNKRNLDDDNDDVDMESIESSRKKEKLVSNDTNVPDNNERHQTILSKEHMLNFPIPIDDGKACIVKIYDEDISLKLNQIIEIIGFISLNPLLSSIPNSEDMTDVELNTHNPPVSLIPRIHAIKVISRVKHEIENVTQIISKAQLIRGDLHIMLTQLLFGDHLAADYLICYLLSSIYMRRDYLSLGAFPLNITNFPFKKYKTFPKELYDFLALLVKKSHFLEITLENLNDLQLMPKKDYECNRLTSGIFQLSDNTHLVIDETNLNSGQVSENGRKNYSTICELIKFQKVKYDFKYYTIEYETDIPILILSEVKSFIPCPTQVILKTDSESEDLHPELTEAANLYLKDENRLTNFRQYLEVLRHTTFDLNEDMTGLIQEDFVRMRQMNKNITVDNLHILIVFARLISLSYGKNTLNVDEWKKAVDMEVERIHRLPKE